MYRTGRHVRVGAIVSGLLAVGLMAAAGCSDSSTQASPTTPSTPNSQPTSVVAVLRVAKAGTGTGSVTSAPAAIDCGDTCAVTYLSVTQVTLTAVPDEGSSFEGFTGDPDCADGEVSTSADISCTAVFDLIPPMIAVTDFLAFGDSFTFGIVSEPSGATFSLVGTPESYPTVLDEMLSARFFAQDVEMDNQGNPGERAEAGVPRLSGPLSTGPDVLLLIHGVNNLDPIGGMSSSVIAAGIAEAATSIDMMVQQGQASGATVFLATLPPQRVGPDGDREDIAALVPVLNAEIVAIAERRQATLVDLFNGVDLSFIGGDGLHPTPAGYRRFAELFFAAIVEAFELPEGEAAEAAEGTMARETPPTPPSLRLRRSRGLR